MNIEECIVTLIKKLRFFGYTHFQIKGIISEAIEQHAWSKNNDAQNVKIMQALEKYQKLGSDFLQVYSK